MLGREAGTKLAVYKTETWNRLHRIDVRHEASGRLRLTAAIACGRNRQDRPASREPLASLGKCRREAVAGCESDEYGGSGFAASPDLGDPTQANLADSSLWKRPWDVVARDIEPLDHTVPLNSGHTYGYRFRAYAKCIPLPVLVLRGT